MSRANGRIDDMPQQAPNKFFGLDANGAPVVAARPEFVAALSSNAVMYGNVSFTYSTATHSGMMVLASNTANLTVTLSNSAAVGESFSITQVNTGIVQFSNGAGATMHHNLNYTRTDGKWAVATAFVESNAGNAASWVLTGSMTT